MIKRLIKKIFLFLIKTITVGIVGIISTMFIYPIAANERGYNAIGGEWILILIIMTVTAYFLNKFLKVK